MIKSDGASARSMVREEPGEEDDSQITMDDLEGIRGLLHRTHRLCIKVRRLESIHLHL